MTIIVTGAAGFIGANIVKGLNERGETDIIAVDNLTRADKFKNIVDCQISDYLDKTEFVERFARGDFGKVRAIFHEGACSDTMETDGRYMMDNNYSVSLDLFRSCQSQGVRLLYASSAATYGGSEQFRESPEFEKPLNVYGYSKLLFDQIVRRRLKDSTTQIAGFRYFNVYGPRESHKGRMASVAFHNFNQFRENGKVKLFEGSHGYPNGGQQRDFVYVEDLVNVNLWFLDNPSASGIFNLGTGRAEPFKAIGEAVIDFYGQGEIDYIPFPQELKGRYQSYTRADIGHLRASGCDVEFKTVAQGVKAYLEWLNG